MDYDDSINELANMKLDDTTMKAEKFCTRPDTSASAFSKGAAGLDLSSVMGASLPRMTKSQSWQAPLEGPEELYDDIAKVPQLHTTDQITYDVMGSLHTVSYPGTIASDHSDAVEAVCLGGEEMASYALPVRGNPVHIRSKIPLQTRLVDMGKPNPEAVQPQVKHKEAKHLFKAPQLPKGREVFARAKRAIAERLSSSGSSKEDLVNEKYQLNDNDANLERLNQVLRESCNLGNRKVKAMTGEGSVDQQSSPDHDGSESPIHWSDKFKDQIHEKQLSSQLTPSSGIVDPNAKEKERAVKLLRRRGVYGLVRGSGHIDAAVPSFTNTVSGLKQHGHVKYFSCRPSDFVAPGSRLKPEVSASGKKRLSLVPNPVPLLIDSNSKEQETPKEPWIPNLSELKLRNDMVEQGVEANTITKKNKTNAGQLASNLLMLGRIESDASRPRGGHQRIIGNPAPSHTTRGLNIVQAPKVKERSTSLGSAQIVMEVTNAKRTSMAVSFKSARSYQSLRGTAGQVGSAVKDTERVDGFQLALN